MSLRSSSHVQTSVKPAPEFTSTAFEVQQSPPLTSSLHSRNSASSAQESTYLRQASRLGWARLALSVLLVGVGAAIVGCQGHALHQYNMTVLDGAFFLPLWPSNADLRPTLGSLISGAVVILANALYSLVSLIPSPRSRILYLNIVFLLTTIVGLAATAFATAYVTIIANDDIGSRETIHSWTCKWYNGANDFNADALSLQLPLYKGIASPTGFGRLCRESMVAFDFAYAGLGVEVAALAVAIIGLWIESRISKLRKARMLSEDEKWVNRPSS